MNLPRQHGYGLIELIGVIALGGMLSALVLTVQDDDWQRARVRQGGARHALVASGAARWLSAQRTLLADLVPASAAYAVSLSQLSSAGYLADTLTPTDAFGQSSCLLLRRDGLELDALVVDTGGQPPVNADLAEMAAGAGPGAGLTVAGPPLQARGAFGTWTLDATALQRFAGTSCGSVGAGRVVTPLHQSLDPALDGAPRFLARQGSGADAPWNVMDTPLAIGGAALAAVGDACGGSAALALDTQRNLLTCGVDGRWRRHSAGGTWKETRASYAALPADDQPGDVRLAADLQRAFVAGAKGSWKGLAVDQDGNLAVPGQFNAASLATTGHLNVGDANAQAGNVKVKGGLTAGGDFNAASAVRGFNVQASDWSAASSIIFTIWGEIAVPGQRCNLAGQLTAPDGTRRTLHPIGTLMTDSNGYTLSCQAPDNVFRYSNGKLTR